MKEFEYTFRVSNTVRSFLPPSIKVFSFFFVFFFLFFFFFFFCVDHFPGNSFAGTHTMSSIFRHGGKSITLKF